MPVRMIAALTMSPICLSILLLPLKVIDHQRMGIGQNPSPILKLHLGIKKSKMWKKNNFLELKLMLQRSH
jgi:hypothetical protein